MKLLEKFGKTIALLTIACVSVWGLGCANNADTDGNGGDTGTETTDDAAGDMGGDESGSATGGGATPPEEEGDAPADDGGATE